MRGACSPIFNRLRGAEGTEGQRDGTVRGIMLQVKLFAQARQLAGRTQIELPWSDGQNVLRLKTELGQCCPALVPLIPSLLVAINNVYAANEAEIRCDDEVACFPPVSGG